MSSARPVPSADFRCRPSAADQPCRWIMTLAAAVVLGLHGLWLMIALRPMAEILNPSSTERAPAPVVTYLGAPAGRVDLPMDDVRYIRSPVLFALPTRLGYSAPLFAPTDVANPPDMLPVDPPRLLAPERPFGAPPFGASARDLAALVGAPRPQPVPAPFVEPDDTPAAVSNQFLVYWQDRPDQPREVIPATGSEVWAGRDPWTMVLFVCFDADGLIRQVMVEKPSPYEDVTAAVLRVARGMVFGVPAYGDCGRLVVVYRPAGGGRPTP